MHIDIPGTDKCVAAATLANKQSINKYDNAG